MIKLKALWIVLTAPHVTTLEDCHAVGGESFTTGDSVVILKNCSWEKDDDD